MSRSRLRLLLWRWHRRLGLAAALFVLLVAVTGILLNHTSQLALMHQPVRSPWLLSLYGIQAPIISSYRLQTDGAAQPQWLSHLGERLYLNQRELAYCASRLRGALMLEAFAVVACADELLLFSSAGEVIERIGPVYGVPQPVKGLGLCDDQLCLQTPDHYYLINLEQLTWQPFQPATVALAQPQPLPPAIKQPLLNSYYGDAITWERVLLDLHNGRLLQLGPWLMDLVALSLLVLGGTGVTMWYRGQRRRR